MVSYRGMLVCTRCLCVCWSCHMSPSSLYIPWALTPHALTSCVGRYKLQGSSYRGTYIRGESAHTMPHGVVLLQAELQYYVYEWYS